MTTVFEKIIKGELPAEKVFENARFLVIKDLYPVAPVHLLIIPKLVVENVQSLSNEEIESIVPEAFKIAKQMAEEFEIEDGYRVLTNSGSEAGQTIFHLHFHLIGGRQLSHLA